MTTFLSRVFLLWLAAILAACSSTPLPPWPAKTAKTVGGSAASPPVSGSTGVASSVAIASPVTAPPTLGSAAAVQAAATGPAVVARFPDPAARYVTPGLAPGRRAPTTSAELTQWLQQLTTQQGSTRVQVREIGRSQRGLPIHALLVTQARATHIAAVEASGRPTVLLVGQQQGDAAASSEALLVLARELAPGGLLESLLAHINVLIVPRANPDGAEMGQATTANGIPLTSDHLLLRTPEAQALARLVRDWRPLVVVDAHEYPVHGPVLQTWRVLPRHDVLLQYAATAGVPEFITKAAQEWYYPALTSALTQANLSHEWYYSTQDAAEPQRITSGSTLADHLHNASSLKNAIGLRISSRGAGLEQSHIQRRVHAQVIALSSALRTTAERARQLEQIRTFVARDTANQACRGDMPLHAVATSAARDLLVLEPRSGADQTLRVQWASSQQLTLRAGRTRPCGYWLAAQATAAVERLKLLGLQVLRVAEAGNVQVESYPQSARNLVEWNDNPRNALQRNTMQAPPGSYFVSLRQPWAHLAVAALEADVPGSYFGYGILADVLDSARVMAQPSLVFEEPD